MEKWSSLNRQEKYKRFDSAVEQASDGIVLKQSVRTGRKGVASIRDKLVFYKQAFGIAEQWAALPKALVFWLSLTPLAVANGNEFLKFIGFPLVIPLEWGSTMSVMFVAILIVFGVLSFTRFGLNRRANEVGGKQNPMFFMLFKEIQELKDKQIGEKKS